MNVYAPKLIQIHVQFIFFFPKKFPQKYKTLFLFFQVSFTCRRHKTQQETLFYFEIYKIGPRCKNKNICFILEEEQKTKKKTLYYVYKQKKIVKEMYVCL